MLSTIGSRLVRPTAQVAKRACSPPRAFFRSGAVASAQDQPTGLSRGRNDQLRFPARYTLARRPSELATEFFPAQVGSIFRDIEDEIARLWDGTDRQTQLAPAPKALGAVDIRETADGFHFALDTPGLSKKDINVRVTPDNLLVVSGERSSEQTKEEDNFRRIERSYGKFERRFALPENVDASGIRAEVKNGELLVTVPKKESEERKTTEIEVEDATAQNGSAHAVETEAAAATA